MHTSPMIIQTVSPCSQAMGSGHAGMPVQYFPSKTPERPPTKNLAVKSGAEANAE
jgi:hypothetical protein